ncbi:MAG: hypothetical protein LH618_17835, partial [Saprospiraceae bacterium]|nr:hypothetical protein [Saprospiraceae bacterium]
MAATHTLHYLAALLLLIAFYHPVLMLAVWLLRLSVVMLVFGVGIALYLLLPDEKRGELAIYRTVDGVDLT